MLFSRHDVRKVKHAKKLDYQQMKGKIWQLNWQQISVTLFLMMHIEGKRAAIKCRGMKSASGMMG
jgi:hypothetical protein